MHRRLVAAVAVGLYLLGLHLATRDPAERELWAYLLSLPLGYAHLLGALMVGRRRRPHALRAGLFAGLTLLLLFGIYAQLLRDPLLRPWVLAPLLLLSAWHIVENDLALARRRAGEPLGFAHRPGELAAIALLTSMLAVAGLATPDGREWSLWWAGRALPALGPLGFADLAGAVLLYHAFTWLHASVERARSQRGRARRQRLASLLSLHAGCLAANALLYACADALHAVVASPAVYLFLSAAHAVQTAAARLGSRSASTPPRPSPRSVPRARQR